MRYSKLFTLIVFVLFSTSLSMSQSPADNSYQQPPKIIQDLVEAPYAPVLRLSPDKKWMAFFEIPAMPSIEEVAQPELRLAGLRINPRNNGPSRSGYRNGLYLRRRGSTEKIRVKGLPENPRIENYRWSPDSKKLAFTLSDSNNISLWYVEVEKAQAQKLSDHINDAMGSPYSWLSDSEHLLFKRIPETRGAAPQAPIAPKGPIIRSNEGSAAPVRTYQDLLENPHDEALFRYYTESQLLKIRLDSKVEQLIGKPAIFMQASPSPDGRYLLVSKVQEPFSYLVPYSRFARRIELWDINGQMQRLLVDRPVAENLPTGFGAVVQGPRNHTWRADAPATLFWTEALDGGDPKKEVPFRDQVYFLDAPFKDNPKTSVKTELRYGGLTWGNDDLAVVYEWRWSDRRERESFFKPGAIEPKLDVLFDRSWEDAYTDPGDFVMTPNAYGRAVLQFSNNGKALFLRGAGASPEGERPFWDRFDLAKRKSKRLWRCEEGFYEYPISYNEDSKELLTRRESSNMPPNYYSRNLKKGSLRAMTDFPHPQPQIKELQKEFITFQREDGVQLSGTLYLPADFNPESDEPLPTLMWAYPREFKDANAAAQIKGSPHEFTRVSAYSPIFWALRGYAVLDQLSMPVIGEGEEEPNERFVEQLVMNAKGAIDFLEQRGVTDPSRVGIGGHSYGAFMTANLMAHSDLFKTGIARSGAYNRTLTPFGFQSEERTYWEARETYLKMSPFNFANQIKEPLLLIHGSADNNSGTYPMQSERFYTALKGHGATARLVMLPAESHGYRAKESLLHMLWEMDTWLETHLK